jgi:hypothetical protein
MTQALYAHMNKKTIKKKEKKFNLNSIFPTMIVLINLIAQLIYSTYLKHSFIGW